MNYQEKAIQIAEAFGTLELSNAMVDAMLTTSMQFNPKRVDFWLDVRNELKRIFACIHN